MILILAQAEVPTDLFGWLTGSSVMVLASVVVALMKRWLVTGAELQREIDRAERAEQKVDQLRDYIEERTLPTLLRVNEVLARGVEVAAAEATSLPPRRPSP